MSFYTENKTFIANINDIQTHTQTHTNLNHQSNIGRKKWD